MSVRLAAVAAAGVTAQLPLPPIPVDGGTVVARASIGASVTAGPGADLSALVREADVALYQAKHAGKGVVRRYRPPVSAQLRRA